MERYEKYKDSGIEWIGEVPEHWEVKKLKYQTLLQGGYAFKSENFTDIGIPVLRIGDIKEQIEWDNCKCYPKFEELPAHYNVHKNDTLIALSGATTGKTCFVEVNPPLAYVNQRVARLNHNNKFLYYIVSSDFFKKRILLTADGSAQENISNSQIENMDIPLPNNYEQTKISSFLDRKISEINKIILNKQKLISLYEEEKEVVINQTVTKGLDPKVKLKNSGVEWLGEIPEHWEVKKLKSLSYKIGDGIHTTPNYLSGTEMYFINGVNLNNGNITITDNTMSVPIEEYDKYKIELEKGAILISLNGTIGKLAIYNNEKVIFGKSAAFIELKNIILNSFVYYVLKSQYIYNYFEDSFSGTTIKNLSLYTLRNTSIPFISFDEQQSIVAHIEKECSRIDNIIEKFNKQIALLQEYRTTLISDVVTGKIKVLNTIET